MKIGISVTSSYRVENARDGARQMIDRVIAANQAGLDSLFVGDHHVTPSPYYQNTPIMGRLLAEWDTRPAGALYLLPLWNPVLAAEQIATLACISQGPFIMQCGLGRDEYQFNAMGTNIRFRPSAFVEALESMRALWNGERVTQNGRWQFKDAAISPLPPEPIKVWIGASAPVAIERAAELGDCWLADPSITLAGAERSIDHYRNCLRKHNRSADVIAIRRDIYVAESSRDAEEIRQVIADKGYRGFDPDALIIGDVQTTAEKMQQFGTLGFTDIIIRNLHTDPHRAVESIRRLGQVRELLDSL